MGGKWVVKVTEIRGIHEPVFIKLITLSNEFIPIKSGKKKGMSMGVRGCILVTRFNFASSWVSFKECAQQAAYSSSLNLPREVGKHRTALTLLLDFSLAS